jgi:23S rRNA pseudouridine1911/1915/1917 synthase
VGGSADRVRAGDLVETRPLPTIESAARPEASVHIDVIHVDDSIVVVNKPAGLVVHPSCGHEGGTLVNGLLALGLFRSEDFSSGADASASVRPGIVHRIDKGTSGLLVVARTPTAREALKVQFQSHSIERVYDAIAVGAAESGTFATLHGRHPRDRHRFTTHVRSGKRAVTHVRAVASLRGATQIECTLETGRTHQIRVHLAESGNPVLGDPVYGLVPDDVCIREVGERLGHQALHARVLGFVHPSTGIRMRFDVPPPADYAEALSSLAGLD